MSTLTEIWTEEKIRRIYRKLDEKTGLNGAELPITFNPRISILGYYQHGSQPLFGFSKRFFNHPNTQEAEAVDVLRHEYAHYYVDATGLYRYYNRTDYSGHGKDWKWACKMVGAIPSPLHRLQDFIDKDWSPEDAEAAYNAEDIKAFDIATYVKRWDQAPVDPDNEAKYTASIKKHNPNAYYEKGDEVLHPRRGFGIVNDTTPFDYNIQKVWVCFEDKTSDVFSSKDLCKMVDGVAIPYNPMLEIKNCI